MYPEYRFYSKALQFTDYMIKLFAKAATCNLPRICYHIVIMSISLAATSNSDKYCLADKIFYPALIFTAYRLVFVCLFVLLLYVPSQQLWSLRDGQFT